MSETTDTPDSASSESPYPHGNIAGAARAGVAWYAGGRVISQAIQLGTSIVLARLLVPDDFGLIAMAVAVGGIAGAVGDMGLTALVVQRDSLDDEFRQAAFTLNTLLFLALAAVQALLAPVAGFVMRDQRVAAVILVLAFGVPIQGFASFFLALLRRALFFPKVVRLNLLSVVVSSIMACSLAVAGFGVWSLVAAQLAASAAVAVGAHKMAGVRVGLSLPAAWQHFREILDFGRFATGNSIISYLVHNADYLLIGRLLSTQQLGFYYFSYEKSRLLSRRLLSVLSSISLPVFSRVSRETDRIRNAYRAVTVGGAAAIIPTVAFLACHAGTVIPLVFGEKWHPSVLVFQILSVHVVVNAVTSGVGSVLYAVGRPDISFRVVRWFVVPLIASYYVGARVWGIVGVAVAVVVVKSLSSVVKLGVCYRFLGWRSWPTLKPVLLIVMGAVGAGMASVASASAVPAAGEWVGLSLAALVFGLVFALSQVVLNRDGLELTWRAMLGAGGLKWCGARLPGRLRALIAIPSSSDQ